MIFIDTNVAIDLRDDVAAAGNRLAMIASMPVMSLVTRIELEAGVERYPEATVVRRALLNEMLSEISVMLLTLDDIAAYGRIVAAGGFDRRRILDRLIAAQCLTRSASLITGNPRDFADIPDLRIIAW